MERYGLVVEQELPPKTTHLIDGYVNTGVANLQSYEAFDVDGSEPEQKTASAFRDEQKEAFMAAEVRNPTLNNCPKFIGEIVIRRGQYNLLSSLMYNQSLRKAEGGIYSSAEDEMLDELLALRMDELGFIETASLVANGDLSADERLQVAGVLKSSAREIYGLPAKEEAGYVLMQRLRKAQELATRNDAWGEMANYVLQNLSVEKLTERQPSEVKQTFLQHYDNYLREECGGALEYAFSDIGDKEEYSPQEIKTIFDRYIEARGYDKEGWQTEIVENRTMCATVPDKYIVKIGDKRPAKDRTRKRVAESMLHEVEIHAGRVARGKKLGHGLAGYGLPGYLEFEEPFATAIEEIYSQQRSVKGEQYVAAIAISAGFDGTERDFRDSFELAWRLTAIKGYKDGKNAEEATNTARKSAYTTLIRIWRGMPTDIPGCIYPKDRVYYNEDVWRYLTHNGNPLPRADFLRLLQAKYDPRESSQNAYIKTLTDNK
ncbi:MAG TPA: hypothetical protein VFI84_02095 [Candidatus Saccharimonadales bacterium]|nr:hypothetical protein [Candidatus Saccharimonadales bacterium]